MTRAFWKLSGLDFELARAEHCLSGCELAIKKYHLLSDGTLSEYESKMDILGIRLEYGDFTEREYDIDALSLALRYDKDNYSLRALQYNHKYGIMTQVEYDRGIIEITTTDTKERNIALIEFDFKCGHIDEQTRDRMVAAVNYSGAELTRKLYEVNFKYGALDSEGYERGIANLDLKGDDLKLALLDIDLKYNHITKPEHSKKRAEITGEPWVSIPELAFSPDNPAIGSFDLDWNPAFIEFLGSHGYVGETDESIIEQWINDLCRNIAIEAFDGNGSMDGVIDNTPRSAMQ